MSNTLNLNPAIRQFDDDVKLVSLKVDAEEITKHKENLKSNKIRTLGNSVNLYPKEGDIVVYVPGSNQVISVLNGVDIDKFKSADVLASTYRMAGIARTSYDPNKSQGYISVCVRGVITLSIENNSHLKNGDKIQLALPKFKYIKKNHGEDRITFGVKMWSPASFNHLSLDKNKPLSMTLKKITNDKTDGVDASDYIKYGDLSNAILILKTLLRYGVITSNVDKFQKKKNKTKVDHEGSDDEKEKKKNQENKNLRFIANEILNNRGFGKTINSILYDERSRKLPNTNNNLVKFIFDDLALQNKTKNENTWSAMIKYGKKKRLFGLDLLLNKDKSLKIGTVLGPINRGLQISINF